MNHPFLQNDMNKIQFYCFIQSFILLYVFLFLLLSQPPTEFID